MDWFIPQSKSVQFQAKTLGVFHLPRDSGKFRKLRWEMLIAERRVPFDTLVPFIPGSLHRFMYFPPKYKMAAQLLLLNEMLDFSLEEECLVNSDDDDISFLAAVETYTRCHLPRNKGFYENICLHISLRSMNLKATSEWLEGPFKLCAEKYKPQEELLSSLIRCQAMTDWAFVESGGGESHRASWGSSRHIFSPKIWSWAAWNW